jgi:hypothetical protein
MHFERYPSARVAAAGLVFLLGVLSIHIAGFVWLIPSSMRGFLDFHFYSAFFASLAFSALMAGLFSRLMYLFALAYLPKLSRWCVAKVRNRDKLLSSVLLIRLFAISPKKEALGFQATTGILLFFLLYLGIEFAFATSIYIIAIPTLILSALVKTQIDWDEASLNSFGPFSIFRRLRLLKTRPNLGIVVVIGLVGFVAFFLGLSKHWQHIDKPSRVESNDNVRIVAIIAVTDSGILVAPCNCEASGSTKTSSTKSYLFLPFGIVKSVATQQYQR